MSRDYFARIEFSDINKYHGGFDLNPIDKIWRTLIDNMGIDQILTVREHLNINYSENLVDYTACVLLGCSSGVKPQNSLSELVKELNKNNGVKVTQAYAWSLHPDKIEAKYPEISRRIRRKSKIKELEGK